MSKRKREVWENICPGQIIEGNPDFASVLCKDPNNAKTFNSHEAIEHYCNTACKHIAECKSSYKQEIANIFESYGKEVIEYTLPDRSQQ